MCTETSGNCQGLATNAYCNLLASDLVACGTTKTGTCWVLPPSCAGTGNPGKSCDDPVTCKTGCDIIKTQTPWYPTSCTLPQ
jgi:hypothetical protein